MAFEIWLAFAAAAAVILIIPGPTIILVLGHSITYGKRATIPLTLGVTAGDFTALIFSLLGLSTILLLSAELFLAFKWAGAAYLFYLGISMWRSRGNTTETSEQTSSPKSAKSLFTSAWFVTSLNPKGIIFFAAFLPQFLDPTGNTTLQMTIMGSTFLTLALLNAAIYAIFATRIRHVIQKPKAQKIFNRGGGTALITAGVMTVALD